MVVNGGATVYSIHLDVARCSSKFFFDVATGRSREPGIPERGWQLEPSDLDTDLVIKVSNGKITKLGQITNTVLQLKE